MAAGTIEVGRRERERAQLVEVAAAERGELVEQAAERPGRRTP